MKKLFYVVLVIVVLLVIGRFVKNEFDAPEPQTEVIEIDDQAANDEISAAVSETINPDAIGDGEVIDENIVEANPCLLYTSPSPRD